VAYRYHTVHTARRLGLTGWVRNLADGRVELEAQGAKADLEELASWCRGGPPGALVISVDARWEEKKSEFADFDIRY